MPARSADPTKEAFRAAKAGNALALKPLLVADPALLQAQGTMSAAAVPFLERFVFPRAAGIPERLTSGATFLDVGAGVAAVSIELCRRFPRLRAVGLEPAEAPLALARRNVEAAGLGERIELRRQLVQELDDADAFDIAWLPPNFLPNDVLRVALARVHRALRPGGLALVATLGGGGDDLRSAIATGGMVPRGADAVVMVEHAEVDLVGVNLRVNRAVTPGSGVAFAGTDITTGERMPSSLVPMSARRR